MATTCDYCGDPITDGRVTLVPTPDPTTMIAEDGLDFHLECQRAFLAKAKDTVTGNRPSLET